MCVIKICAANLSLMIVAPEILIAMSLTFTLISRSVPLAVLNA
jgi:hypothetical protein